MPKNLHPYYLQQMGIQTWLMREPLKQSIKLMVVGEAMEASNKQASNLFNNMLSSIGLSLEDVCFKSSLTEDLVQQITKNPPQLLLVIDKSAVQLLLNQTQSPDTLRCKTHVYQGIPLIVSYHPTELLQHPIDKKNAYQDLLRVQQILAKSSC